MFPLLSASLCLSSFPSICLTLYLSLSLSHSLSLSNSRVFFLWLGFTLQFPCWSAHRWHWWWCLRMHRPIHGWWCKLYHHVTRHMTKLTCCYGAILCSVDIQVYSCTVTVPNVAEPETYNIVVSVFAYVCRKYGPQRCRGIEIDARHLLQVVFALVTGHLKYLCIFGRDWSLLYGVTCFVSKGCGYVPFLQLIVSVLLQYHCS